MVPAGNKAERLSSVNHTTKTIHHDHHRHHHREIALKTVCKDFKLESQEWQLLIKYGCMNIHHKNLLKLVTGIFKVKNGWSPEFINDVFEFGEKPFSLIPFQVEEDPYNKTCRRNAFLPWHWIMEFRSKWIKKLLHHSKTLKEK